MRQATHAFTTLPEHAAERQRLRALRSQIESTLEEMVQLLDALDSDPDLEPEEDVGADDQGEPSMGAAEGQNHLYGWMTDFSPVDEAEAEDGDAELGWANDGSQMRLHADGSGVDREPSLGATGGLEGSHSASWREPTPLATDESEAENEHGTDLDAGELDDSDYEEGDTGIADPEGLAEQAGMVLDHAEAEANRAAAREAAERAAVIRRRRGCQAAPLDPRGICNVTIIGAFPARI